MLPPTADDLPAFAIGTALDQGGRLVLNLFAAGVLGPSAFGAWIVLSLLIQYSNFASLGVHQGAGREIPRLLGASDPRRAARVEDAATTATLLTAPVAAGVAVALAPHLLGSGPDLGGLTLGMLWLVVVLQQLMALEQVLFRSRLRFRPAALQMAAQGLAAPAAGGTGLVLGFGLIGLLIGRVAAAAAALALVTRTLERVPRPRWDPDAIRGLMRVGAPMLGAGILFVLLVTVDRWVVLLTLGREAVGQYGLVGLVVSALILVPNLISQQQFPRLAFARGEGQAPDHLGALARSQSMLAGKLTAGAATIVGGCSAVGLPAVLPDYQPAIVPILLIAVGVVCYATASGYGNLLNLLGRQRRYIAVQAIALALNVGLALSFVTAGLGLSGVALASTISLASYALMLRAAANRAVQEARIRGLVSDVHPAA